MSLMDLDERAERRMIDYLKPEDLDTEACITLAQTILSETGAALQRLAEPGEPGAPGDLPGVLPQRPVHRAELRRGRPGGGDPAADEAGPAGQKGVGSMKRFGYAIRIGGDAEISGALAAGMERGTRVP